MSNKQVTIKVWADTRQALNHIKEITRESLVLIIHRLAADELARLKNLRERTRATWEPTPRPREVIAPWDTDAGEKWLYSTVEDDDMGDDPGDARCESRCPFHTQWSIQAVSASPVLSLLGTRTRCTLGVGHEGNHLGPDDSSWPQEEAEVTEIGEEWLYSQEYND